MKDDIIVRVANYGDMRGIFELSNQPSVRDASFQSATISWSEHVHWFKSALANPSVGFYVAIKNENLVGQIRFLSEGLRATVSISVDPMFKGKGIGKYLYHAALADFRKRFQVSQVIAKIKKGNVQSIAFFEKLGFVNDSEEFANGEHVLVMIHKLTNEERGIEITR